MHVWYARETIKLATNNDIQRVSAQVCGMGKDMHAHPQVGDVTALIRLYTKQNHYFCSVCNLVAIESV